MPKAASLNTQSNKFQIIIIVLLLLVVGVLGAFSWLMYKKDTIGFTKGENIVYKSGQVLGISTDQVQVNVDFSKQTKTGSPLIFGGAHAPRPTDLKAWDEVQAAGFTSLRSDFFIDRYLPANVTIEQYKNNVNGIRNAANWNQTEIAKVRKVYQEARKRNMKTVGILAYAAKWFTHSETNYGVPKDWSVYEDVVDRSYRLFRNDIDFLEIWNEPDLDHFLDVKNTTMTKDEAYYQIVKHAVPVIRRVDREINDGKKMKIGIGVVSQTTNVGMMQKILADEALKKEVNFVSYHNYEHINEPSSVPVEAVLRQHNVPDLPIYLTEWAHSPNMRVPDPYVMTELAIPYAGAKLIDFMNMGLAGANYFALQPIVPDSLRGDEGFLGIYNGAGDSVSMLPIVKTWELMSDTLRLGKGTSKVFETKTSNTKVAAWQNVDSVYGLVVSNESSSPKEHSFSLQNVPYQGDVLLTAFVASELNNGKDEAGSVVIATRDTGTNFKAVIPAHSVVGIKITQATFRDKFRILMY